MRRQFVYKIKSALKLGLLFSVLWAQLGLAPAMADASGVSANSGLKTDQSFSGEMRAVWISYFELDSLLKGRNEKSFREAYVQVLTKLKKDGMNATIVQVRPFGDALYRSKLFPSSYLVSGTEGGAMAFDPLSIMIEENKKASVRFEAWLNPYRVRINSIKAPLAKDSQASKWLADGSGKVVKTSSGIYFNPSDPSVNALFLKGVKEIVDQYAVDGIHLDDYFYPTTTASFDAKQFAAYQNAGGKLMLADFRRSRIDDMVRGVYQICKSGNRQVSFGISPQGIMKNNFDGQFANVKKWMTEPGYVDYICPQIYYGYDNSTAGYTKILKEWSDLAATSRVDLYIGLAPYKIGLEDSWAKAGKLEWIQKKGILRQMVVDARQVKNYKGFMLFRYDSLWNPSKATAAHVSEEKGWLTSLWLNVK